MNATLSEEEYQSNHGACCNVECTKYDPRDIIPHTMVPRQREERSALNFSRRVHPCGNPRKTCKQEAEEREDRGWQLEIGPFLPLPPSSFHNVSSRVVARSASDFQMQSQSPGYPTAIHLLEINRKRNQNAWAGAERAERFQPKEPSRPANGPFG